MVFLSESDNVLSDCVDGVFFVVLDFIGTLLIEEMLFCESARSSEAVLLAGSGLLSGPFFVEHLLFSPLSKSSILIYFFFFFFFFLLLRLQIASSSI